MKACVKSVLNYKKPSFWIVAAAVAVCIVTAVCFLTNPKTDGKVLSGEQADQTVSDYPVYDSIAFDVDGDGKQESCTLGYGKTSGVFTFAFTAADTGSRQMKYNNTFCSECYDFSFVRGDDGVVRVQGINPAVSSQTHLYDIAVVDGNIHLTEGSQDLSTW